MLIKVMQFTSVGVIIRNDTSEENELLLMYYMEYPLGICQVIFSNSNTGHFYIILKKSHCGLHKIPSYQLMISFVHLGNY